MPVPAPMRYVGCAVAVIVIVVRPVLQRGDDAGGESLVPRGTWESQLLVASVLLVSGSAVAALLAVYWLAVSGVQRLPQLLHAVDAAGQCGVQPVSQG
jgi:hypothetical protein